GQYVPHFVRSEHVDTGGPPLPETAVGAEARETGFALVAPRGAQTTSAPAHRRPLFRLRSLALALVVVAASVSGFWLGRRTAPGEGTAAKLITVWDKPVWSDEFDGRRGSASDPTTWSYDVGNNGGWGNNELEVYCAALSAMPPCDPANPNT